MVRRLFRCQTGFPTKKKGINAFFAFFNIFGQQNLHIPKTFRIFAADLNRRWSPSSCTLYILCIYPVIYTHSCNTILTNTKMNRRNNHINPVLYEVFFTIKNTLGAQIVHRRSRKSPNCIEIIFTNPLIQSYTCRVNTLKEAEACGFWIICRAQNKRGHTVWHGRRVFQLFLTPVHPHKRHEARVQAVRMAQDVSFEPIYRSCPNRWRWQSMRLPSSRRRCMPFPSQNENALQSLQGANSFIQERSRYG